MFAPKLSVIRNTHDDQHAIAAVEVTEDHELADARLTAADRRFVRRLLALATRRLSDEGLIHLAGGAEDAAWRKRAGKAAAGW